MRLLLQAPLVFFKLFYQSVYLALGQIWANKTRSILTTIGIVIGVASVTAVIAALTGLKTNYRVERERLGILLFFLIKKLVPDGLGVLGTETENH